MEYLWFTVTLVSSMFVVIFANGVILGWKIAVQRPMPLLPEGC